MIGLILHRYWPWWNIDSHVKVNIDDSIYTKGWKLNLNEPCWNIDTFFYLCQRSAISLLVHKCSNLHMFREWVTIDERGGWGGVTHLALSRWWLQVGCPGQWHRWGGTGPPLPQLPVRSRSHEMENLGGIEGKERVNIDAGEGTPPTDFFDIIFALGFFEPHPLSTVR